MQTAQHKTLFVIYFRAFIFSVSYYNTIRFELVLNKTSKERRAFARRFPRISAICKEQKVFADVLGINKKAPPRYGTTGQKTSSGNCIFRVGVRN